MENKRFVRRWLWWFTLAGAVIILYRLFSDPAQVGSTLGRLTGLFTPFIGGFALAFLLLAPSRWLEDRFRRLRGKAWQKLARPLSLVIV